MRQMFFQYKKGKRNSFCTQEEFQILRQLVKADSDNGALPGNLHSTYVYTIIWAVAVMPDSYQKELSTVQLKL